ncbi:YetF domain-containing protein [Virgibacillus subterraneus]|uniref:YetF domain-containing protein n=1 Tax=Virgibacillus subterraneus TaxID=621109 RepID=UPI000A5DA19C|nr:YetF domain-containing protein [Virgibacillus subterraneus]
MENSLRKTRLDIEALKALLRQKNVFSMSDVSYAIFETSGILSVMKKEIKLPATKGDMNVLSMTPNPYPIATEIISDGVVNTKNLAKLNLDRNWLEEQINNADVNYLSQIFYAEVQSDGTLYIDKKDDII